jgi:hypothetical protein
LFRGRRKIENQKKKRKLKRREGRETIKSKGENEVRVRVLENSISLFWAERRFQGFGKYDTDPYQTIPFTKLQNPIYPGLKMEVEDDPITPPPTTPCSPQKGATLEGVH